jgi:hypothetical protein
MASDIIVSRGPDRALIELLATLEEEFGSDQRSLTIGGIATSEVPEFLAKSRKSTYAISEFRLIAHGRPFTIKFTRNHNNSPYFDLIQIEPQRQNHTVAPTVEMLARVDEIIRSKVKVPEHPPAITSKELGGIIEKEIADLAALHRNLLDDALKVRNRYDEEDAARRARFEEEIHVERQRIADHAADTQRVLLSKSKELDEKIKEFDLSDHMRARRRQREEITEQIQGFLQRPTGARTSSLKMSLIVWLCISGFGMAGFFAYESFESFLSRAQSRTVTDAVEKILPTLRISEQTSSSATAEAASSAITTALSESDTNDYMLWLLAARGVALSAVAIGFIVYLLTFLRRNHDEELQHHRELQRYGMDINRASWVIETAMEMTTKENASLPEAWVAGACSGLFQSGRASDGDVNSLNALGAVLGLGPDVEVGPTGAKLSFSSKATKAAAKESGG